MALKSYVKSGDVITVDADILGPHVEARGWVPAAAIAAEPATEDPADPNATDQSGTGTTTKRK